MLLHFDVARRVSLKKHVTTLQHADRADAPRKLKVCFNYASHLCQKARTWRGRSESNAV